MGGYDAGNKWNYTIVICICMTKQKAYDCSIDCFNCGIPVFNQNVSDRCMWAWKWVGLPSSTSRVMGVVSNTSSIMLFITCLFSLWDANSAAVCCRPLDSKFIWTALGVISGRRRGGTAIGWMVAEGNFSSAAAFRERRFSLVLLLMPTAQSFVPARTRTCFTSF